MHGEPVGCLLLVLSIVVVDEEKEIERGGDNLKS
jgi:hypothetical protein